MSTRVGVGMVRERSLAGPDYLGASGELLDIGAWEGVAGWKCRLETYQHTLDNGTSGCDLENRGLQEEIRCRGCREWRREGERGKSGKTFGLGG